MSTSTETEHGLESEFEHQAVPASHRKPLASVAAVWFGFPMILTCAVFGGILAALLGFQRALVAILIQLERLPQRRHRRAQGRLQPRLGVRRRGPPRPHHHRRRSPSL